MTISLHQLFVMKGMAVMRSESEERDMYRLKLEIQRTEEQIAALSKRKEIGKIEFQRTEYKQKEMEQFKSEIRRTENKLAATSNAEQIESPIRKAESNVDSEEKEIIHLKSEIRKTEKEISTWKGLHVVGDKRHDRQSLFNCSKSVFGYFNKSANTHVSSMIGCDSKKYCTMKIDPKKYNSKYKYVHQNVLKKNPFKISPTGKMPATSRLHMHRHFYQLNQQGNHIFDKNMKSLVSSHSHIPPAQHTYVRNEQKKTKEIVSKYKLIRKNLVTSSVDCLQNSRHKSRSQAAVRVILGKYKLRSKRICSNASTQEVAVSSDPNIPFCKSSQNKYCWSNPGWSNFKTNHCGLIKRERNEKLLHNNMIHNSRNKFYSVNYLRQRFSYHGYCHKSRFRVDNIQTSKKYIQRRLLNTNISGFAQRNNQRFNKRSMFANKFPPDHGRLVLLNGFLYRSSTKKLERTGDSSRLTENSNRNYPLTIRKLSAGTKTITVRGVKFQMDSSGRTIKRIASTDTAEKNSGKQPGLSISRVDIGGVTYIQTKPGTLVRVTTLKQRDMINQVISRSVAMSNKNKKLRDKTYCIFFNRFGKCHKANKCPYVHDPEKIAICTRFLRGTCHITSCPFSHKVDKHKMPVCSFFLKGRCVKDTCSYLHVKVNKNAAVCEDFINGFCSNGDKCKKKHTLVCSSFFKTGMCINGTDCRLKHAMKRKANINTQKKYSISSNMGAVEKRRRGSCGLEGDEPPTNVTKLPAFISLNDGGRGESTNQDSSKLANNNGSALQIVPRL